MASYFRMMDRICSGDEQSSGSRSVHERKETADIFETSWITMFRAVKFVVDYGLTHRNLEGVMEIGVDEIAAFKGHK
jgi:hypothetical protein